jgi:chromosomal replication initiator protein
MWFQGHTTLAMDGAGLRIGVPNRFFREWLEKQFQEQIDDACRRAFGKPMPVEFRIEPELFQKNYQRDVAEIEPPPVREPAKRPISDVPSTVQEPAPTQAPSDKFRPRPPQFTLGSFVVGTPNRVAHAAAAGLVDKLSSGVSPLFLYGGAAVGKTHLLRAIENDLRRKRRDLRIACYGCEEFTNEFVEAYRGNKLPPFRRKIRSLEVLLIDDVQFLGGKKGTQEEILHAFEAIQLRGGKVVLAGDVHPRRLGKLSEDLKSRFLSGMAAKLEPPNREMRRQIFAAKAAERGLAVGEDITGFVADQIRSSVREIEGAVNFLAHFAETLRVPLDFATARTALAELLRHSTPCVDVPTALAKACSLFQLSKTSLNDKSRAKSVAHPRMLVVYLVRKHTGAPYAEIGRRLGGLNHSTVMAAEKKVAERLVKDDSILLGDRLWKLRDAVEAFERELGAC